MERKDILVLYNELKKSLRGEWIILGGGLLHILGISERETIDLDLVPAGEVTNSDQLQIMDIAEKNGFPPEVINFSAEFFFKKQHNWRNELVLIFDNENVKIYRPTARLFRILKEQRGTETDFADIKIFEKNVTDSN